MNRHKRHSYVMSDLQKVDYESSVTIFIYIDIIEGIQIWQFPLWLTEVKHLTVFFFFLSPLPEILKYFCTGDDVNKMKFSNKMYVANCTF